MNGFSRTWLIATAALAFAALNLMLTYRLVEVDSSDALGYVQASHQLARGEGLAFVDPHNTPEHRYYLLYAFKTVRPGEANGYLGLLPGVPLLGAALERITGDPLAVHFLTPLLATVLLIVISTLGYQLISAWAGWWAAAGLVVSTNFLQFSTALYSEVPGAALIYSGIWLTVLALRRPRDDGRAALLALSGGGLMGASFFVRFSNASVWPAALALLPLLGGKSVFRQRRAWANIAMLVAATVGLLLFNAIYYGGPFVTGYSPQHGWYTQPAFSLGYAFGQSFGSGYSVFAMLATLWRDLGGLTLAALVGLVARPRSVNMWLALVAVTLLAPYTIYAFAAEGLNARFIIPALPALFLLAGKGLTALGARLPGRWHIALGLAVVSGLLSALPTTLAGLEDRNQAARASIARAQDLSALTEPNAVLMSYTLNDLIVVYGQRSMLNYRHIVPWDRATGRYVYERFEEVLTTEVTRLLADEIPVYYVLDRDPPLLDSFAILQRHFDLQLAQADRPLYRVLSRPAKGAE